MGTVTQELVQEDADIRETTTGYVHVDRSSTINHETHPELTEQMRKVTLNNTSSAKIDEAPTIQKLKRKHIQELASLLDPMKYTVNYLNVGKYVFRGDKEMIEKVQQLKHAYAGGGSAGKAFIEYLKAQSVCTVNMFLVTAKELGRRDIVKYMECNIIADNDIDLMDLDNQITDRIAVLLDIGGPGIKDWRDFAYEYCEEEIVDQFQTAVLEKQQSSPTEVLITLMKTNIPRYKLCDFSAALGAVGRDDAKQVIVKLLL